MGKPTVGERARRVLYCSVKAFSCRYPACSKFKSRNSLRAAATSLA